MNKFILPLTLLIFCFFSCKNSEVKIAGTTTQTHIEKKIFGTLKSDEAIELYTLSNTNGMRVSIMTYGGIVVRCATPDKTGNFDDVVLGCDSLSGYFQDIPYFGAIVGRYGNRIDKGKFSLDGKNYQLNANSHGNHLHGGVKGFDKVIWTAIPTDGESPTLKLSYLSKDGEENYPGNLKTEVVYTLQKDNALCIDYTAICDKKTVINLTNHSYFNLSGKNNTTILDHDLILNADRFLPVDKNLIPTGELKPVAQTNFDFTKAHSIGERINDTLKDIQLKYGMGYDHAWILNRNASDTLQFAGRLSEATSGRVMEFFTTEPAIQFYTGNFLDGTLIGKSNTRIGYRTGLCLETEHYPDSPNHPSFPTTVLDAGKIYKSSTVYKFSVMK